ncbi:hypothetical protein ACFL35_06595 [Candidatus Riflebacteria bacterium]
MSRRGSAVIVAVGLAVVLLFLVAGFSHFSIESTRTASEEGKAYIASSYAEAGLNLVIGELRKNPEFLTHTKVDPLSGAKNYSLYLQGDEAGLLKIDSGTQGVVKGTIGFGEFRVAICKVKMKDDRKTPTINESDRYYRVVSMGKYKKSVRKISAIIQKNLVGKEYLMYNGGVLPLIYGKTGVNEYNYLGNASFYGHNGIEVGRVSMEKHQKRQPGTGIKFFNTGTLETQGGVWVYHSTDLEVRRKNNRKVMKILKANYSFPTRGKYPGGKKGEEGGEYPEQMAEPKPLANPEADMKVLDEHIFNSFNRTPPKLVKELPFAFWEQKAKDDGIFLDSSYPDITEYQSPYKDHPGLGNGKFKCIKLNFGPFNGQGGQKDDPLTPRNNLIYSKLPLLIYGNPDKNLLIVSEKDIFIIGDFNQAGKKGKKEHYYGFPQNYPKNEPKKQQDYKYPHPAEDLARDYSGVCHKAVSVIAKARFWYDYRNPLYFLKNELRPYLAYEIARMARGRDVSKVKYSGSLYNQFLATSGQGMESVTDTDVLKSKLKDYFSATGPFFISKLDDADIDNFIQDIESDSDSLKRENIDKFVDVVWKKAEQSFPLDERDSGVWKFPRRYLKFYELVDRKKTSTLALKDFIYYPEYTVNAMLWSWAKHNGKAYRGPDQTIIYEEIGDHGSLNPAGAKSHSHMDAKYQFYEYLKGANWDAKIVRLFGTEIRLGTGDLVAPKTTGECYAPGLRKKIYDPTLPLNVDKLSPASYVIISWNNYKAKVSAWNGFN